MAPQESRNRATARWAGTAAGVVMALLWFSAGFWKLTDIGGWQLKLTQLLVPVHLSLVGTLAVGVSEVLAGILLLWPRWRRWGGLLSVGLLLAFMGYMGVNYQTLQGEDCSCFPWLERAVGPAFFWSDAAMLAVSLAAVRWSLRPSGLRGAAAAALAVAAFAGVMVGVERFAPQPEVRVAGTVTSDGGPVDLQQGSTFLFFFNPSCMHCLHAGQTMAEYDWNALVLAIPTQDPDWGPGFLQDAGLEGVRLSPDADSLRETFEFQDVPFGAVVRDGAVLEEIVFWEEPELSEGLRRHGFID